MKHQDWQDLIPYYIAGTLDAADTAALERHLARCTDCRAALAEWRTVALLVHNDVNTWASQTPPMSDSLRAALAAAPPSHAPEYNQHTVPVQPITDPVDPPIRQRVNVPRLPVPLTLAAVLALLIGIGGLMITLSSRGGDGDADRYGDSVEIGLLPTFTPRNTLAGSSATPQPSDTGLPPTTTRLPGETRDPNDDLGIILPVQPTATPNTLPTLAPQDLAPGDMSAVGAGGAAAMGMGGASSSIANPAPLENTCSASPTSANRIAVYPAPFTSNSVTWIEQGAYYNVISTNTTRDWYQLFVPHAGISGWVIGTAVQLYGPCSDLPVPTMTAVPYPTATPVFSYQVGGGYNLVTTERVGDIASGARVRISSAWQDGGDWLYAIETEVGIIGQARAWQLTISPAGPTPTSALDLSQNSGYVWLTTQHTGTIPANTRVTVSYSWYTGDEWIYKISTRDGRLADARAWQLTYSPDMSASATPTRYATPTASLSNQIGAGYNLITLNAVGTIPQNSRVRISSATYDGTYWHYTVVPQYNPSETAHAYAWQLSRAETVSTSPTPTPAPSATP